MTSNVTRAKPLPSLEELRAIILLLPSLNYYHLLKVSRAAQVAEIQSAFHREALQFHPDRYQGKGRKDSIEEARQIYLKIVDAYNTLSDREKRNAYDQFLNRSPNPPSAATTAPLPEPVTQEAKKAAPDGPGLKFFKLAQSALQSGQRASAKLNIQLALNMEPDNSNYKKFADRLAALK